MTSPSPTPGLIERDPELLTLAAMAAAVAATSIGWATDTVLAGLPPAVGVAAMAVVTVAWAGLWVAFTVKAPRLMFRWWRSTGSQLVLFVQALFVLAGWFGDFSGSVG